MRASSQIERLSHRIAKAPSSGDQLPPEDRTDEPAASSPVCGSEPGRGRCTDADSPGGEGSFFVWTPAELADVLGPVDGPRLAALAGVTSKGTFERGTSVLRLDIPLERHTADDRELLARAFPALKARRSARPPPARDDKAITSWNALMLGALARGGAALGEPTWIEAAARCAHFLLDSSTVDGRLIRSWKDGRATLLAYADDYAALSGGTRRTLLRHRRLRRERRYGRVVWASSDPCRFPAAHRRGRGGFIRPVVRQ